MPMLPCSSIPSARGTSTGKLGTYKLARYMMINSDMAPLSTIQLPEPFTSETHDAHELKLTTNDNVA